MEEVMHIEQVDPRILVPNPLREKARTVPDKEHGRYLMIRDSIVANGIKQPIIVQRSTKMILGGHTRCEIAIELELAEVPVQYVDADEDEALHMLLEDNLDHAEDEKDPMKIAWQCKELMRLEGIGRGRPQKMCHGGMFYSSDIASKLNMGKRTFHRYVSLNKLIPTLQRLVSSGKIGIVAGDILSQLPRDKQEKVFESIKGASISTSYVMSKQDAESFRRAFDSDPKRDDSSNTGISDGPDLEEFEFYGSPDDLRDEENLDNSFLVDEVKVTDEDTMRVFTEPSRPDVLGVVSEVESGNGQIRDEQRNRIAGTRDEAQEKMKSLLSINDEDARRTFAITQIKSSIRAHQLAIERAEIDLISELATLDVDGFDEIKEPLEIITKCSERVSKKLTSVLEEMRNKAQG